jgi:hypothetical protein
MLPPGVFCDWMFFPLGAFLFLFCFPLSWYQTSPVKPAAAHVASALLVDVFAKFGTRHPTVT